MWSFQYQVTPSRVPVAEAAAATRYTPASGPKSMMVLPSERRRRASPARQMTSPSSTWIGQASSAGAGRGARPGKYANCGGWLAASHTPTIALPGPARLTTYPPTSTAPHRSQVMPPSVDLRSSVFEPGLQPSMPPLPQLSFTHRLTAISEPSSLAAKPVMYGLSCSTPLGVVTTRDPNDLGSRSVSITADPSGLEYTLVSPSVGPSHCQQPVSMIRARFPGMWPSGPCSRATTSASSRMSGRPAPPGDAVSVGDGLSAVVAVGLAPVVALGEGAGEPPAEHETTSAIETNRRARTVLRQTMAGALLP